MIKTVLLSTAFALAVQGLSGQQVAYKNAKLPATVRAKDLLSRMNQKEKIGQLSTLFGWEMYTKDVKKAAGETGVDVPAVSEKFKKAITEQHIGMLWGTLRADPWTKKTLNTGLSPKEAIAATNAIQKYGIDHSRLGIPLLLAEEAAHGLMAIGSTVFPTGIGQASTWNDSLINEVGRIIAKETRALGSHIAYGPILDLAREPRWSRVEETYGEDPYLVSRLGQAFVEGLQGELKLKSDNAMLADSSVIATLKHYVAYGVPLGGHNGAAAEVGPRVLATDYLPPFKKAVQAGALSVMTAYNSIDGVPCTANDSLINGLLKGRWGFNGFVVSDLGAISGLTGGHAVAGSAKQAAALAINAGVDSDLGGYGFGAALNKAVTDHLVTESVLDSAVYRLLLLKFRMGLFENPYRPITDAAKVHTEAASGLNEAVARESVVLLKDSILPLRKSLKSIAVIGPNADNRYNQLGDYTAPQAPGAVQTVYRAVAARLANTTTKVHYAKGCSIRDTSRAGFEKALDIARRAEVVIMVMGGSSARDFKTKYKKTGAALVSRTLSDMENGEGNDRSTLTMMGLQDSLLRAVVALGKPVVLVMINGRPMSIEWASLNVSDILEAWYPGAEGGAAIAEALFGDYNPSGRLPVSIPRSVGQLPVYYNHDKPGFGDYVEGSSAPLYPFGFGLSYSSFKYSAMTTHIKSMAAKNDFELTLAFKVTNSSNVAGTAVPQLYFRDKVSSVVTKTKQLCGYEKCYLLPGQSKQVVMTLHKEDLKLLNQQGKWVVEPGEFKFEVASSSAKKAVQLTAEVNVEQAYLIRD